MTGPPRTATRPGPNADSGRRLAAQLQHAAALIRAGQAIVARADLARLAEAEPRRAEIYRLLAHACERTDDPAGAERALRAAIAVSKRDPGLHADLGSLLLRLGRLKEAESALRSALAIERRHDPAATALAELLNRMGRHPEALQIILPLSGSPSASEGLLSAHADALRGAGRHSDRLAVCERTVSQFPRSGVAEHNLAAALADLGRFKASEQAARRAYGKGLNAPQTRVVLARALQGQGDYEAAEREFGAALDMSPRLADAQRDLAQLIWMRTGNSGRATARLSAALACDRGDVALTLVHAHVLECAGDMAGAYTILSDPQHATSAAIQIAAARAALGSDPVAALTHARAAAALAPSDEMAKTALCEALLATGDPKTASTILSELRRTQPHNQHLLAYLATAWRLMDDPRYRELCDYDRFVGTFTIPTPLGWASLTAFLADLGRALLAHHRLPNHPFGQSLRSGSQTVTDLTQIEDPVIAAFFQAVDAPIRSYIEAIGSGRDPLRERNQGGYEIAGAWSVRLRPEGGRHVDHVHQKGWLSSAFYVELPPAVEAGAQEGWLRFGAPGIPTSPPLGPEHVVQPQNGRLVLFPSYMWHGTSPFGGERTRLSLAFDVTPSRHRREGLRQAAS